MADKKKEKKVNAKQYLAELGYAMDLINSDPSLQEFIKRVRKYMDDNENRTPTSYELDGLKEGIEWFEKYNAEQELARMQQADPRRRADFERSVELRRQKVQQIAQNIGVELDDAFINALTLDARLNQLTDAEIEERLAPKLQEAIAAGQDIGGRAAEFERELVQWSRQNGLSLTGQTIAKYVAAGVEGRQTIDDMKNDLRRTYLVGQYPAWASRIEEGYDPSDIAQPYKARMASLLEMSEDMIDLNDNLLQRAMEGVGADGKPSVVPLYKFEENIRNDPRWQYTDNARSTYSEMADQLLRMFGMR